MSKILIIGELIHDVHSYGAVSRIGPDAPYPIFIPKETKENWGGAGNVVKNLESLLPDVEIEFLHNVKPIIKKRYVEEKSNYILLREDIGDSCDNIHELEIMKILNKDDLASYDACIFSDYGKGFLKETDILRISRRCHYLDVPTFIDSRKLFGEWSQFIDFIKINDVEWKNNLSKNIDPDKYCKRGAITTLGERGALYKGDIYPTAKVDVQDLSGCGDVFCATFVASYVKYIKKLTLPETIRLSVQKANKAASLAASRKGVVTISGDEIWSKV